MRLTKLGQILTKASLNVINIFRTYKPNDKMYKLNLKA